MKKKKSATKRNRLHKAKRAFVGKGDTTSSSIDQLPVSILNAEVAPQPQKPHSESDPSSASWWMAGRHFLSESKNLIKIIISPLITLLNRSRTFKWDKLLEKKLTKQSFLKKQITKIISDQKKDWWKSLVKWPFTKKEDQDHHPRGGHSLNEKKSKSKKRDWPVKFLRTLLFPFINPIVRYVIIFIVTVILIGVIYLLKDLPSPRRLTTRENFAVSTQIFDRNGVLLYEIFADENRIPITFDQVPQHMIDATVAIEDQRYYQHFGVDLMGITRALINNLRGEPIEGGSTITQQLVKNALLTKERTVKRKVKEAILAVVTEIIYSKEQIMEMYLNYISYGGTAVGIEAASQQYFDKHVEDLTLAESALLAGLPKAPSTYSPFGSDTEKSKLRQHEVIRRMVEDGLITDLEAESAKAETLVYALKKTDIKAPHFVFYVRDLLYREYGVETVERGGLRVTTTLDLELQDVAQASLSAEIANLGRHNVGNGATLIVKPNTGEILTMIGSTDYFDTESEGEVNVTIAQRQPGSSIKPINYATAIQEKAVNPGTVFLDVPTCFLVPGQKPYCPKNYDGGFKGPVTIRQALGNSLNIPAVKVLRTVGVETLIKQANKMGISSWVDPSRYGLSLTLGGGEVTMVDMAQAFSVLANQGVKVPLAPILKVEDYQGNVLDGLNINQRLEDLKYLTEYETDAQVGDLIRVMDRAPAYLTSHIMQDNNARSAAFGTRSELVIPNQIVSAKTGTTNDMKDNWTIGFTPEFLVATWVGNNDNTPMNRYLVSGVTGAAPIFNDIMSYVLKDRESIWQEKPPDVGSAGVCANGMPPSSSDNCKVRQTELYWQKGKPSASKVYTKEVWVHPETGLPLKAGESTDGLVLETKTLYSDPVTPQYCSDCTRAVTEDGKTVYERNSVEYTYQANQQSSPE